jgi:hypothetical protein
LELPSLFLFKISLLLPPSKCCFFPEQAPNPEPKSEYLLEKGGKEKFEIVELTRFVILVSNRVCSI